MASKATLDELEALFAKADSKLREACQRGQLRMSIPENSQVRQSSPYAAWAFAMEVPRG